MATVWDGAVAGFKGALKKAPETEKILILSGSQAAIAATRRAGRRGKARTRDLKWVVEEIGRRQRIAKREGRPGGDVSMLYYEQKDSSYPKRIEARII